MRRGIPALFVATALTPALLGPSAAAVSDAPPVARGARAVSTLPTTVLPQQPPAEGTVPVTWWALGDAEFGTTVARAEQTLGTSFRQVSDDEGCRLLDDGAGLSVVSLPDSTGSPAVEAAIVDSPRYRFAANSIGVGSSIEDVTRTWPNDWSTSDDSTTGQRYVLVNPRQESGPHFSGALFRFDQTTGVITEFKVGRLPYSQHELPCSTPD